MEDYQNRVIQEAQELEDKIKKLENFIFRLSAFFSLSDDERLRLVKQYCHMNDYYRILKERILNFK